ncbi:MAG TPA: Crp/Fnr family transcriptional regulator [Fimbriiglobus sp.]|nr:Crp/Fnr family transcriptional regulator [Fimbriiglobus sp.]
MTRPAILDAFASHEFLQSLDDRCLMDLASGASPFTRAAGEYLTRAGETSDALYLIQSGTVLVGSESADGELAPLMTVGPGGVVGCSWVVPPYDSKFTSRAVGPVHGLVIDAAWLRDRCERNHELGYHLHREINADLTRRLVASQEQMAGAPEPA